MLMLDENTERQLSTKAISADLVVVGGGMAGACAAITAAREGIRVVLVQDRPVLGGNTSSEVRLWMVGATSHMGNNNRWAREGGVLNEILMENTYRNPEGNPVLFDSVLLEKVVAEPTLTLLLNTAASEVAKTADGEIESVTAFCSQNSTRYVLQAPLFCDASGDGIIGFLSGAAFRIGAESKSEFGEQLAPEKSSRELLGHSIYFYTRDTGRPVRYVAPEFALKDIKKIPRYRRFNTKEHGTDLWWIEYGGSLDTIHEAEKIKWELWKIIYGVWNHIKNSGQFPDADTLTLDWVGLIPGKRESRRFEGDYMLIQPDIVEQRTHYDAVSYGGWAIDHHPVDNIYSEGDPCTQWHSKGVYQIPYRTMYSRNVSNLFLAGRIISASHIAFGSSRVMATCGHSGQAVGMAAAICCELEKRPRELVDPERIGLLQTRLLRTGQFIPQVRREDSEDLAQRATVTASSCLKQLELSPAGTRKLSASRALLLPVAAGEMPEVRLRVRTRSAKNLSVELRTCSRAESFTPDVLLESVTAVLTEARTQLATVASGAADATTRRSTANTSQKSYSVPIPAASVRDSKGDSAWQDWDVTLNFTTEITSDCYCFVCLLADPAIEVYESPMLVSGVTSVTHRENVKVARSSRQDPPADSGIDAFEFWTAERRPKGRNLAATVNLGDKAFAPDNLINGIQRPTDKSNAWVASLDDETPSVHLHWPTPQRIATVELVFDPDWDHPMENIVMRHSERAMPTVVSRFRIIGPDEQVLFECSDNHAASVCCILNERIESDTLRVELDHPSDSVPAALFEVRCYPPKE